MGTIGDKADTSDDDTITDQAGQPVRPIDQSERLRTFKKESMNSLDEDMGTDLRSGGDVADRPVGKSNSNAPTTTEYGHCEVVYRRDNGGQTPGRVCQTSDMTGTKYSTDSSDAEHRDVNCDVIYSRDDPDMSNDSNCSGENTSELSQGLGARPKSNASLKRKMVQMDISSSDNDTNASGPSSSEDGVESDDMKRSPELDDIIDTVNDLIGRQDFDIAYKMITDMCARLDKSYKTETDGQHLDYSFYFLTCADLYRGVSSHTNALRAFYKGFLHMNVDTAPISLPVYMVTSCSFWNTLLQSGASVQVILNTAYEIQVMTDAKVQESGGKASHSTVPLYIYNDLVLTYKTIQMTNPNNAGARAGKLKTLVQWLRCLMTSGLSIKVTTFCKTLLKEYPDEVSLLKIWAVALKNVGEIELAVRKTDSALLHVTNAKEKASLDELRKTLTDTLGQQVNTIRTSNTPTAEWLEGTNCMKPQLSSRRVEEIRENHVKKRHWRPKAKARTISTYLEAANWSEIGKGRGSEVNSTTSLYYCGQKSRRQKRRRRNTAGSDISTTGHIKGTTSGPIDDSEYEATLGDGDDYSIESDEEFSISEPFRSSIFGIELSDSEASDYSDEQSIGIPDAESMFEQSVRDIELEGPDEGLKETEQHLLLYGAALSPRFIQRCAFQDKKNYYTEGLQMIDLLSMLGTDPKRFKRCTLNIESAHKAVGVLTQPENNLKEIEISGRSKCGKNFTEDEVVVEILNNEKKSNLIPRFNTIPKTNEEQRKYGKVIGRIKRKRFPDIDHPVFVCGLDEIECHLMRPLDATVPKLHIFNKHVENIFQVEVYDYDSNTGELQFSKLVNISPAQKHSYVFLVIYIRWDAVYPLGAVIKVMRSDGGLNSGLKILELQHQVPTTYSSDTVQSVQSIMCRMPEEPAPVMLEGREDCTDSLSVFTVDPQNSKDLDDALSVRTLPDDVTEVGVHIADVTCYVRKGDHVDEEAKARATTFYPGQGQQPHHMLPEPLSQNLCSLLPNKKRMALSVFFYFKGNGDLITKRTTMKKTVVKSRRQFSYKEVQDIILGRSGENSGENESFSSDIKTLFGIAETLRKRRLGDSMHSLPVDVDLSGRDDESLFETLEAHFLIEEFMIIANTTAAQCVCSSSRFRECALLRCQDAPPTEQVNQWLTNYPRIADIVLKLQNIKPNSQRQLKIENAPIARYRVVIELQKWIWSRLEKFVTERNFKDAWKLIGSDEIHPEQALAWRDWIAFQEHAEYRCLGTVNNRKERFHFTLGISPYTHFTSPIRRYADLVMHRLVHAALDNAPSPYTVSDIAEICLHINEVSRRAKLYAKRCRALHFGHVLRRNPIMFDGFVEEVSDKNILLNIPGLRLLPRQSREVALNLLNVSRKPEIKEDRDDDRPFDILTLAWQKRLYSHRGYAPATRGLAELRIDPHQKAIFQQYSRWADILKALLRRDEKKLKWIVSERADYHEDNQLRSYVPACTSTVNDVSSEVRQGAITKHFCDFSMSFSHAQILSVQIGAEPQKGVLIPYPQLVQLTKNVTFCLQHPNDPAKYLAKYATRKAHPDNYRNIPEYLDVWLPLIRMESATMAAKADSITVNDLPVKLNEEDGTFSMTMDFCEDRSIDFSSMSMDFILNGKEDDEDSNETKYVPSSDFLCIKCPYDIDENPYKHMNGSPVEMRFWLAHGQIDKIKKMKKYGRMEVHFLRHPSSPKPPQQLLNSERKPKCSIEIMPKPESNRRTEGVMMCVDKAGGLPQAVALGYKIPKLDKDHLALARRIEAEVDLVGLAKNNSKQYQAIQRALTNRFSLIQGPPGTGKTYTGMKLLYLFTKLNKIWHQEGNPFKQVVFCGPSNKSVDLVASWTKRKLGEHAPRMVRMYGSSHECMDYPMAGKLFSEKVRKAENRPDQGLHDIALHHLIRKEDKPYADEIRVFDRYFQKCSDMPSIGDPDAAKEFKEKTKEYKTLLSKAEQEELEHYDVILCTTAMTTNPKFIRGTKNRIFQCIIDESGMCTEPESLATIIATNAEQVVMIGDHKQLQPVVMCQHAAKLGLQKSLFERYAHKAIMLTTQYRMNPRICDFVSAQFYHNQLETAPSLAWKEPNPLSLWKYSEVPHIFCHVEGEEEYLTVSTQEGNEQSCSNKAEVDKVLAVFNYMVKKDRVDPKFINIISQYNAQCHEIKNALLKSGYINCHVNTVVASQGGEWDYVIFSTARSLPDYKIEPTPTLGWCKQNLGFITDEHQIDVALSRARKGLVIIGNRKLLKCDTVWGKLLSHYDKRGCVLDAKEFPAHYRTGQRRRGHGPRASRQTSEEFLSVTEDMD